MLYIRMISSNTNTTMQDAEETKKRLFPIHAAITATARAAHAEMILPVADKMAGKVITASVT